MISQQTLYERQPLQKGAENSLGKILNYLPDTGTLLDVGCATGALGHYLQANTHIIADAIEAHPASIQQAQAFYRTLYPLDLEANDFTQNIAQQYDIIVIADVLEHLKEPAQTLARLLKLLKPQGTLLISLPNVGHNAVILQLLNAQFNYQGHGLLDQTHLRFFAHQNIPHLFQQAGIQDWGIIDRVIIGTQGTEFQHLLDQGVTLAVQQLLQTLPEGNTYQFILRATKKTQQTHAPIENHAPAGLYIQTGIFYQTEKQQEYQAEQAIMQTHELTHLPQNIQIQLPPQATKIRLDPMDIPGIVTLQNIRLTDTQNTTHWQLAPDTALSQKDGATELHWNKDKLIVQAKGYDSWVELPIPQQTLAQSKQLQYQLTWNPTPDFRLLNQIDQQTQQHEQFRQLQQSLQNAEQQRDACYNSTLKYKLKKIYTKAKQILKNTTH